MNDEDEPNLVTSGKSQRVVVDGYPFSINIHRLETDETWTLEVVDHLETSHVWDDQFRSDSNSSLPQALSHTSSLSSATVAIAFLYSARTSAAGRGGVVSTSA